MDVSRATSELAGSRFSRFSWVAETGSTNADLLATARSGAPEQVLGADFQTAGRGRMGRVWEAGRSESILMSVLVRPGPGLADPHLVTTAMGLAAAEAVAEVTGRAVGIKWPNDLVAGTAAAPDDRKVAGVLAESVVEDGRVTAVVVGIGINVNRPDDLSPELAGTAVSLRQLTGAEVDRTDLVVALVGAFGRRVAQVETTAGALEVRHAVATRSATLGRRVRVERSADVLEGLAVGMTPDGHLIIEADGEQHEVSVGDVVHLRPVV